MLQQFSWTTFLVSYAVVSALWFLSLSLTVFRKDTMAFLSSVLVRDSSTSPVQSRSPDDSGHSTDHAIMGKSKMPEGLEMVSMGALSFSVGQDQVYNDEDNRSDQLGLVPDVLQELKEIFAVLAKEDGDKQDFFSLAAMISEKYGRIASHPNIGKINGFIQDHAPFSISLEELENLWD